jgi:hypothetical protein
MEELKKTACALPKSTLERLAQGNEYGRHASSKRYVPAILVADCSWCCQRISQAS